MPQLPVFDRLCFGTAGLPAEDAEARDYTGGLTRLHAAGLSALELEFVQEIHLTPSQAEVVGRTAAKLGIHLSAHASYYVNLASAERPKVHASVTRIVKAARVLHAAGGHSVVFHAAFYQGRRKEEVYSQVARGLAELEQTLAQAGVQVWIRPELTGKPTQFGDPAELIRLSQEFATVLPCLDFSHLHARFAGRYNSVAEWEPLLDQLEAEVPREKQVFKRLHIHLSGIDYSAKGERKHLPLAESDLAYRELIQLLKRRGAGGIVVCEGPRPVAVSDAQALQAAYDSA